MKRNSVINLGADILIFSSGVTLLLGITVYLIGLYEQLIRAALM
jgi:hypothetical protein